MVAEHASRITESLRSMQAGPGGGFRSHLVEEGVWIQQRLSRFSSDSQRLDAHEVARLCVLLGASIELRDVAWAEMTHESARKHVDLWRDVVRRSPPELRAAPATLLGFAAWLSGNGALAWCAVDCAQQCDPDYNLAALLADALAGAIPPSVWRPFPRDSLTLFAP
jgi:AcrR family transcriptional regulator